MGGWSQTVRSFILGASLVGCGGHVSPISVGETFDADTSARDAAPPGRPEDAAPPKADGGHDGDDGSTTTPACVVGETRECYGGPPGTLDVGPCKAGKQRCRDDGSGFSPCEGTVLPTLQACNSSIDSDCDGAVNDADDGCCEPGTSVSCYRGPSGTAGVGVCHEGVRTCPASGLVSSDCTGEQLPTQAENCALAADENCDATAPACWTKQWSLWMPGPYISEVVGLDDGVVARSAAQANQMGYMARVTDAGAVVWQVDTNIDFMTYARMGRYPGTNADMFLVGSCNAGLVSPGVNIPCSGGQLRVSRLDGSGALVSGRALGLSTNDVRLEAAIADSAGSLYLLASYFLSAVNDVYVPPTIDGETLPAPAGDVSAVLIKLDASGQVAWMRTFGEGVALSTLASTDSGIVLALGSFMGPTLMSIGGNGTTLWSTQTTTQGMGGVLVRAGNGGDIWIGGSFTNAVEIGGRRLQAPAGTYLARLDASGASKDLWAFPPLLMRDFRVRADGHVLLIGTIEHQPLDLTVGHFSGQDWHTFFAEVDTTGAFQALLPVRGSVTTLVERPNGSVVLGGFADWLSGPSPGPLVVGDESSMPPAANKNGFLLMRNP